jgi:hypothetical protein
MLLSYFLNSSVQVETTFRMGKRTQKNNFSNKGEVKLVPVLHYVSCHEGVRQCVSFMTCCLAQGKK